METLLLSHRLLLNLIADTASSPFNGDRSIELIQKHIDEFLEQPEVKSILFDLEKKGLISRENLDHNHPQENYHLTVRGSQVYEAIQNNAGLLSPRESVILETFKNSEIKDKLGFVLSFYYEWMGDLVHWLGNMLHDIRFLENNIFFCYVASQTSIFDWLAHSLVMGSYDIVLRELRSILEGLFVVYSLELVHPDESLEDKLDRLSILESSGKGHGKTVFSNSGFKDWPRYYSLYRELCTYVHITRKYTGQQMQKIAEEHFIEVLEPTFDLNLFFECVKVWEEIAVLATELTNSLLEKLGAKEECRVYPAIFYLYQFE